LALAVMFSAVAVEPAAAATRLQRHRDLLLTLTNRFRHDHGIPILGRSASLNRLAQHHSRRMASDDRLFHTTNLSSKLSGSVSAWGENVGYGMTIRSVFTAFVRSAPHRANLLDRRFRRVGIGIVRAHGVYWITMIFSG
jgi:uncharacterized protein YkwD